MPDKELTLVTGATGFLGGHIARALAKRGDAVRVLVRNPAKLVELPDAITLAKGDVTDPRTLEDAFVGVTRVVHAAGMLGAPGVDEAEYLRLNADGTKNVLTAARAAGVHTLVHMSSPAVLGHVEGSDPVDEEAPLRPTNPWEVSMAAAERNILEEEAARGPFVTILRAEIAYGPGDLHVLGLFRAIKKRAFFYIGSGDALCQPTYIDDVGAGVLAALDRGARGRTYHLAGPLAVSMRTLAETFAGALGVAPPFVRVPESAMRIAVRGAGLVGSITGRPPPLDEAGVDFFTHDRKVSTARARRELEWAPLVDLEAGAARTVAWYRDRGLL